jgi:Skp family chaperone for outer membrane proteins
MLVAPLLQNVDDAIAAVAKKQGLDFVLDKSSQGGNSIVLYAADNQVDITQQVIKRLTSK